MYLVPIWKELSVDNKATPPGFRTGMPANKKQGVAVSGHLHIQPVHWINKAWYSRCFLKPREHFSESNESRDSVHTIRTSCTREIHLVGYTDHACLTFSADIISE